MLLQQLSIIFLYVDQKLPSSGRSYLTRTLKEHLYQCPSKLSEELVGCMAAIYCFIGSKGSANSEASNFPFLSRSSTSIVPPRQGHGEPRELVEVTSISMDKNHFSSASCAISNYRLLVEQLERVDASALENNVKLAFWINVYNCLIMHAYLSYGIPHSSLRRMALFNKAAYNIGGHTISANAIENSVLCCRTPRIGRWFETMITTAMRKKYGEEKQVTNSKIALVACQPLVLFALCNGAASDPMLRVYTAKNVIEDLEKAKKEFLQTNVIVKKSKKIYLPKILERYAKETSLNFDDLLKWVTQNLDKKTQEAVEKCSDCSNKRKPSQIVDFLPYNTRFRYVFEKDLTEKPWWV
ncbi:uncharacterized protein LOC109826268 [Asparagus officinalis]|uniref:uncharacterized protein LOC109826268 n=1 Tax=Asparagus officinalis TaxID=4686 RepID=UPI00098E02AB|nr:uncharacterized protein LOC109826268 [Asparagus officinalis]